MAYTIVPVLVMVLIMGCTTNAHAQYTAFDDPPQGGATASGGTNPVGPQEFAPTKPEVDGGEIAQGQTAQVLVLLHNYTNKAITLDRIELAPSSNISARVTNNQCAKEAVKANLECAVTLAVKGESTGKFRLGLLIYHNGKSALSNAFVVGNVGTGKAASTNGLPANEIEAFPIGLDFGQTKGRTPLVRSIALRNASGAAVKISNIELAASPLTGFSVAAPDCKELQPSQACVATVTWSPLAEGKSQGVLVLRHNGPSGNLQIPLSGEYVLTKTTKAEVFPNPVPGEGLIVADRESIDFGTAVDSAAAITTTLINNGEKDVTLKQVKLSGGSGGLSLSDSDCAKDKVLKPYQGCALTVSWAPNHEGPIIDDVQIIHDGARGVLVLPVRGTATKIASSGGGAPAMISNSIAMPKLEGVALDEKLVSGGEAHISGEPTSSTSASLATDVSTLNGYRVTSLSPSRAILAGPRGRLLVKNKQKILIAGGYWEPEITDEGVKLTGDKDKVLLVFDRTVTVGSNGNETPRQFPQSITVVPNSAGGGGQIGGQVGGQQGAAFPSAPATGGGAGTAGTIR